MDKHSTEAKVSTVADEVFSVLRISEKPKDTHRHVTDESNEPVREEGEEYYEGEDEEEVEEITENELLAMLDAEQDPMLVCLAIFKQNPTEKSLSSYTDVLDENAWRELWTQGWTVIDNVVEPKTCMAAREEALSWWQSGLLKPPRSIKKEGEEGEDCCGAETDENELDPFRDHSARDDVIRWMHHYLPSAGSKDQEQELADTPGLRSMLSFMDSKLRPALNQFIHLRGPIEVQLACYAPENGGRYEKHRDSFPCGDLTDEDQRRVTCIFYLNTPDWNMETDGGALRLFGRKTDLPDAPIVVKSDYDVEPKSGRLLVFLSGVVDHAVLPSNKQPRVAMTAWLR